MRRILIEPFEPASAEPFARSTSRRSLGWTAIAVAVLAVCCSACSDQETWPDSGPTDGAPFDAPSIDGGPEDGSPLDGSPPDGSPPDASPPSDGGAPRVVSLPDSFTTGAPLRAGSYALVKPSFSLTRTCSGSTCITGSF